DAGARERPSSRHGGGGHGLRPAGDALPARGAGGGLHDHRRPRHADRAGGGAVRAVDRHGGAAGRHEVRGNISGSGRGMSRRYSRQQLFEGIGPEGQARIRAARVLVVGCGALGSSLAEMMARAGVGSLTVVDRDDLEESNLQRQSLFDEHDLAAGLPKAAAAEAKLRAINSEVRVTGLVADVSADNAAELVRAADLVLDGTDNFETRFLINDVCVREGVPWVYGACVGSYGAALAVRPRTTPCLRCQLEEPPPPGSAPT